MSEVNRILDDTNRGLATGLSIVGSVAGLVTAIGNIIARRRAAGEDTSDLDSALAEFNKSIAASEARNAEYWALPEKATPSDTPAT